MVKITLKDGSIKEVEKGLSIYDIAKGISEGLARMVVAGEVNGKLTDLREIVDSDIKLNLLRFDDVSGKQAYWHTASHVMAQAVKRLYPNVKLAIGPSIENGFYYDFDIEKPFTPEQLEDIEKEMKKIIKEKLPIEKFSLAKDKAIKLMKEQGEIYKVELIEDIPEGEEISFYKQGDFSDLCAGPHLLNTGKLKAVKLLQAAGAYWRGSEKNKMLQRIYGIAFPKATELQEYLEKIAEAKKRDHNKLGREQGIFMTSEMIGQGLPILMPKGAKLMQILQRFIEDEEEKRGYQLTKTPFMAKSELYKVSGHWDHYKDDMFVLGNEEKDDEILALRPMTCPFQFQIYNSKLRSYRDLPIRYNETATLFRKEASGEMHGLIRVRQFTLAEGHIACTPEQLEGEFRGVIDLIKYVMEALGIDKDIWYRFSKWDPKDKNKYVGSPEAWDSAQSEMKRILDDLKIEYIVADGEAAFYGPKLDLQFRNVHGKEDTIFTVQVDFSLAERFDMTYIDQNNEKKRPIIIHRSSLGCYERTIAMLIEKYAGAFPVWMAPTQVIILPIIDKQHDFSYDVMRKLEDKGIRVEIDTRNEKIGYRIREARLDKIPYMLVIGDREIENGAVSVRNRKDGDLGQQKIEEFISKIMNEVDNKLIED